MGKNLSPFPDGSLVLFPDEVVSVWRLPDRVQVIPFHNGRRRYGVQADQIAAVCQALGIGPAELINGGGDANLDGVYEALMPSGWYFRHGHLDGLQRQYLEFCGLAEASPASGLAGLTAEQLARLEGDLASQQTDLDQAILAERRSLEGLKRIEAGQTTDTAGLAELYRIIDCPEIEDIEISFGGGTQRLVLHTVPIRLTHAGTDFLMGAYKVSLTRYGESYGNTEVRMENKLFKISDRFDHPHVRYAEPCLGNIKETLYRVIGERRFQAAAFIALEFLKNGYDKNDGFWGEHSGVGLWPRWQDGHSPEALRHVPRKSPRTDPGRLASLKDDYLRLVGLNDRQAVLSRAQEAVRTAGRQVSACQERLCRTLASLAEATGHSADDRDSASQEIVRLVQERPELADLRFIRSGWQLTKLTAETEPLTMVRSGSRRPLKIGRLELTVDRQGAAGGLAVRNLDRQADGCPHPYVDRDGRLRSDNIQAALPALIAERQFVALLEMALDFLHEPTGDLPAVEPGTWAKQSGG